MTVVVEVETTEVEMAETWVVEIWVVVTWEVVTSRDDHADDPSDGFMHLATEPAFRIARDDTMQCQDGSWRKRHS